MDTQTLVIWIVMAVVGFGVLFKMAQSRGRNPVLWGVFGAVTLVIALIAILIAGKSDDA